MLNYPKNYIRDALIRFAYHSDAIEGNSLSLGQTQAIILDGILTSITNNGVRLCDIYEVSN